MLSSAHNKLLLLAGLEWIRIDIYRELRLIRRIRNEFAHHVEHKSFGESPIRDFIGSMEQSETTILDIFRERTVPRSYKDYPDLAKLATDLMHEGIDIRSKFLIRSCLARGRMITDMEFIQAALLNRVDPGSLSGGFDTQPDNIKHLARTVSRLCFLPLQRELAGKIIDRAGPEIKLPPGIPWYTQPAKDRE